MSVKLLTEQHVEFLSLTGGCTGSSESIHVKMQHCWKSHVAALLMFYYYHIQQFFSYPVTLPGQVSQQLSNFYTGLGKQNFFGVKL